MHNHFSRKIKSIVLFIKIKAKKHLWKRRPENLLFHKGNEYTGKNCRNQLIQNSGNRQRLTPAHTALLEKLAEFQQGQRGWWLPSLQSCMEALDHQLRNSASRTGLKLLQDPILRESSQSDLHGSSLKISLFMNSFYLSKT